MELEQEAQTTRKVLDRVPKEKLTWKPHSKSMSLGQLALHVAVVPGNVARLASPDTFELQAFTQPQPEDTREIIDALGRSIEAAKEIVGGMDDARVLSTWTATRDGKTVMALPRIAFLRAIMLNHWYHHRGQLCVYLRLLDIPLPSVYGPTADENPFA
jgi:uncharacterized damage-inducible protein DinB